MPQSLQSIYSFDCEVIFCILKFSPFLSCSVFVDCEINNGVPPNLAYAPRLFQHVFVPDSCNNDDDDNDDDDDDDDDDDINGFVMMMMMMMIVIMVMLMR